MVYCYNNTVYGKKSFLSAESDTMILQSIYFAYKVGIISSKSNRTYNNDCYNNFDNGNPPLIS